MRAILALVCYIRAFDRLLCARRIHQFAHCHQCETMSPWAFLEILRRAKHISWAFCQDGVQPWFQADACRDRGACLHGAFPLFDDVAGKRSRRAYRVIFSGSRGGGIFHYVRAKRLLLQGSEERRALLFSGSEPLFSNFGGDMCHCTLLFADTFCKLRQAKKVPKSTSCCVPRAFRIWYICFCRVGVHRSWLFQARKWTKHRFGDIILFYNKPIEANFYIHAKSPVVLFSCAAAVSLFSCAIFSALAPSRGKQFFCRGLFAWRLPYRFCFSPQWVPHPGQARGIYICGQACAGKLRAGIMPAPAKRRKT